MLRILHDTKIDFIRLWRHAAIAIAVFILPALVLIPFSGFNYSIEFTGGTLMQVAFKQPPDVAQVRAALTQGGVPGVEIARFGDKELVIRAQESETVNRQAGGAESVATQIRATLDQLFGGDGDVFFRGREGALWYIYQLKLESGQIRKFTEESAVNSPVISPDRRWIVSWVPNAGKDTTTVVKAFPTDGGPPVTICSSCYIKWPRDQNAVFLSFAGNGDEGGTTYVLRLAPGKALPDFPSGGVRSEDELKQMPILTTVKRPLVFPGATSSVYAYDRSFVQRNLHRIPIAE